MAVMVTYEGARTAVRVGTGVSQDFEVKVGVHQDLMLSPLLFVIVMQAVTRKAKQGLPWELLYADDLVLMADSRNELRQRTCLVCKGLRVNVGKTKVMCSKRTRRTGAKYPCGVW